MTPALVLPESFQSLSPLVYVVDDEMLLAQIMEAILQVEGYAVKMFSDPAAALEAFRREPTKPRLLITDYVMQPMNGLELIQQCRCSHPAVRAIVVSGNVGPDILEAAPTRPDAFIAKPFLPKTLLAEVNTVLGNGAPQ